MYIEQPHRKYGVATPRKPDPEAPPSWWPGGRAVRAEDLPTNATVALSHFSASRATSLLSAEGLTQFRGVLNSFFRKEKYFLSPFLISKTCKC